MDRTLIRPSRSHLNKKVEILLGCLQLWSLRLFVRQRETHWVLNSLHLRSEGHLQRLKQLNIPPSGALTPTSQGPTAPYISNLQLQIQWLFFCTSSYCRSITPSQLKKHLSDSRHTRHAHSETAAWWRNFVLCRLALQKKYFFIYRFMKNKGKEKLTWD